jgi:hypothetical protein
MPPIEPAWTISTSGSTDGRRNTASADARAVDELEPTFSPTEAVSPTARNARAGPLHRASLETGAGCSSPVAAPFLPGRTSHRVLDGLRCGVRS